MPHLVDSAWGGATRRKNFSITTTRLAEQADFDPIDDERRLLFVGITRAKTTLLLSSSVQNTEGKQLLPSRLLADIDAAQYAVEDTEAAAAAYDVTASLQQMAPTTLPDATLFTELLSARGFSATSINNYLRSPWDYVYRNLLRIPETQPVHMQFGTVVHMCFSRLQPGARRLTRGQPVLS